MSFVGLRGRINLQRVSHQMIGGGDDEMIVGDDQVAAVAHRIAIAEFDRRGHFFAAGGIEYVDLGPCWVGLWRRRMFKSGARRKLSVWNYNCRFGAGRPVNPVAGKQPAAVPAETPIVLYFRGNWPASLPVSTLICQSRFPLAQRLPPLTPNR